MSKCLKEIRVSNNLESLLENPLGVALAGTNFHIDRNYTTKKLKFKVQQ